MHGEGKARHQNATHTWPLGNSPTPAQSMCLLLENQIPILSQRSITGGLETCSTGEGREGKKLGTGVGMGAVACVPRILRIQKSPNTSVQSGEKRQHYTFLCQEMVAYPRSLESFGALWSHQWFRLQEPPPPLQKGTIHLSVSPLSSWWSRRIRWAQHRWLQGESNVSPTWIWNQLWATGNLTW